MKIDPKCVLCSGQTFDLISNVDSKSGQPLGVGICKGCGLVQQLNPRSESALLSYYSHNYRGEYKGTYAPKSKHVLRAAKVAQERIDFLARAIENLGGKMHMPASLLDVGAGGGEFVYVARRKGFEASGIEPNIGYSEFARTNYGVSVETLHLHELSGGAFDVVTLFHVLEHLPDPVTTIESLHGVLRKSGLLFIEIPNIEQRDASPANIFFMAHIFYFSVATLVSVASPFFELIQLESRGNIRAIFMRRDTAVPRALPTAKDIRNTSMRIKQKGWVEYLTTGGGWKKPLRRIIQLLHEGKVKNKSPKAIIDSLLKNGT